MSLFMKKTILLLLVILLTLVLVSSFLWLYEAKYFIGRASVTPSSFSADNSYLFISPLQAKAGNEEKIRLTVFILNNQGLGVLGKKVVLQSDPSLKIEKIQETTNEYGKAVFDVASTKAGEYYLEVMVENIPLKQKAHLTYY